MRESEVRKIVCGLQSNMARSSTVSELRRLAKKMRARAAGYRSKARKSKDLWASEIARNAKIEVYETVAREIANRIDAINSRIKGSDF